MIIVILSKTLSIKNSFLAIALKPNKEFYCCPENFEKETAKVYCYEGAKKTVDNIWMATEVCIVQ